MQKKLMTSLLMGILIIILLSCSSKPLPDQGVKIIQPKEGVSLKAGDSYEVLWKTEPSEAEFGKMVTIEFSKDGGESWENVQENVPNSGKYAWSLPKLGSAQCKVRVISQHKPKYRGTSEIFSIK